MNIKPISVGLLLMTLLFSSWLHAAVDINEQAPQTYIVKSGDTL